MEKNPSNKTSLELLENLILNRINENAVMCLSMFQAMDAFESTRQKLIDDFFIKRKQHSVTDLGLRMKAAFNELLPVHSSVRLIGTDIPHLSTDLLEESILYLKNTDVILGPSDDGGYYLIGMKKPNDYLFQNMTWSIDTVLSETIQRISINNKTYHLLKTLPDIDTADDWEKHGWF